MLEDGLLVKCSKLQQGKQDGDGLGSKGRGASKEMCMSTQTESAYALLK